jgi:colanic acid/amylovoran biosynthesis glycosyltransferase
VTAPLRIAIFVNEFPALSETFVLGHITGLLDRGHHVEIFANQPRDDPMAHADVARYELLARTHYQKLPHNRIRRVIGALPLLLWYLPRRPAMLSRTLNPLRLGRDAASLRLFYWAVRLLDAGRFDILHCHFGQTGSMVAALREAGVINGRLVTTFHGVDVSAYLTGDSNSYRHLFATGDWFMPVSHFWRRRLIALGCDSARLSVQRMGVDTGRFHYRLRPPRGAAPLRILTVGRLVEKKGVDFALQAVAQLCRQGLALRYTVIGDGPLRPALEARAAALGIAEHVAFRGWQPHREVVTAMYDHHVLLAPSVTSSDGDQEGIPVTLMEAMATGMPVVSTRHSGIPELIEDGVSGLLAAEGDVDALAAALLTLAGSHQRFSRIGQAARRTIEREFDLTKLNDDLVSRYRALLSAND